jgi:hypothetical protein
MTHTARRLVVASFALLLGCGVNGQGGSSTPPGQPAQAGTGAEPSDSQAISPGERALNLFIRFEDREIDGKTQCVKTEPIQPGYTMKARHVNWHVINDCTEESIRAEVDTFAIKALPGPGKPDFPFDPGSRDCTAGPGGHCTIGLTVRNEPPSEVPALRPNQSAVFVYTYDFKANGATVDPELIIEWF